MKRLVLALFLSLSFAYAQSVTGTIVGTVRDATGIIGNARISVTNQDTGIVTRSSTNQTGDYSVPNLPAGMYRVQAEYDGYQKAQVNDVRLLLNQTVRTDIELRPGDTQQMINVTADAPVVQSETSSVASVIDTQAISSLPVNGRTLDTFILTAAGNTGDSASNPRIGGSQYWGGTNFTVDGVSANDLGNGGGAYSMRTSLATQPSLETISEFKVESNAAKAEYSGSVAVSIITKSGTNEFHGSLFEYNRNAKLAANQFFSNSGGRPKAPYNRNEFGVAGGGPVIRNKTFFYGSYEGSRIRQATTGTFNLPTAAQRTGNFTGFAAVKDPTTGLAFPNNIIPTSRIDSRAAALLGYVPGTNRAGTQATGIGQNYVENVPNRMDVNRYSARVDHHFNDANILTASLNYSKGDPYFVSQNSPSAYGNYADAGYLTKSAGLTYTRVLSASMTNELRASYYALTSTRLGQNTDFNPATLFPGLFTPLPMGGLPTMQVTGYTNIGDLGGSDPNPQITKQIGDTLSWIRGAHTIKAGVDVSISTVSTNPSARASQLGTFRFNGRYTGNAFSDFLLGVPYSVTRAAPSAANVISQNRYGFFLQDDWKVSSRLTLNYGMRYELQTNPDERAGSWSNFDYASRRLVVRSVDGQLPSATRNEILSQYPYVKSEDLGWGSDLLLPDHKNFAPRIGLAYRPFANNKTVIRSGYGIFYNMIPVYQGIYQLGTSNPPFTLAQAYAGGVSKPTITLADPFSVSPAVTANPVIYAVNRQIRNPYSQQWNLTIEQELPWQIGMRTSYIGNRGSRVLFVNYDMNQPVTQQSGNIQTLRPYQPYANIYAMMPTGNATTHQLQVEGTRRLKNGIFFQTSLSWTKSLSEVGTTGTPQNPYDASADRGYADGVRPVVFYLTGSYDLPFGKGQRFSSGSTVLNKMMEGWRISPILQLKSGSPFSVTFTPTLSGWYATRANVANSNVYPSNKTIDQWFNPAAFSVPDAFTFGNSARNLLFGPGVTSLDLSIAKTTSIREKMNLQFRGDFFNLPNTPSFGNPATDITIPSTVGRITSTTVDARTIQFGLKLLF